MLKTSCIHPEIMQALSLCGHGDKIAIVDGNYPAQSRVGKAKTIYLGLCKGLPTVPQVLHILTQTIAVEHAEIITPDDGTKPAIFSEVTQILENMQLDSLKRFAFYEALEKEEVRLVIATGEERTYSCLLLTVGVV